MTWKDLGHRGRIRDIFEGLGSWDMSLGFVSDTSELFYGGMIFKIEIGIKIDSTWIRIVTAPPDPSRRLFGSVIGRSNRAA